MMRATRSSYLLLLFSCHLLQLISSGEETPWFCYCWMGLSHYQLRNYVWWTEHIHIISCVLTANVDQTPSSSSEVQWTVSSTLLMPPSRPSGPAGSSSRTSRTCRSRGESSGPADTTRTSWSVAATLFFSLSRFYGEFKGKPSISEGENDQFPK